MDGKSAMNSHLFVPSPVSTRTLPSWSYYPTSSCVLGTHLRRVNTFFSSTKYKRQIPRFVRRNSFDLGSIHQSHSKWTCVSESASAESDQSETATALNEIAQSSRPSAQQVDPERARHFEDRLSISRTRTRQLYSLLLSRFIQTATDKALDLLSAPSPTTSNTTSNSVNSATIANVARRLRKQMRSVRSTADEKLQPDDLIWTAIARLQTLIEQLELKADTESAYLRDRLQEDVEHSIAVQDDATDGDMRSFRETDEKISSTQDFSQFQPLDGAKLTSGLRKTVSGIEGRVSEFVKKDGSIDVDGLRGWARRVLDSISMIWMRLNGKTVPSPTDDNGIPNSYSSEPGATISSKDLINFGDPEREFRLREEIGALEKLLNDSSKERESALRREDQLGKLIRARELRLMDDQVNALRRTLAVRVLQLELERVLAAVAEEVERTDFDTVLEQRVLVIEFGDLDERLSTLDVFVELEEAVLIEDDVLGELAADMQDMKTRLGLDSPLYSSSTISLDQLRQFLVSLSKKARDGYEFYTRGLRLFFGDLRFAWSLITKTVMSSYTPSAREVRTLRRTGRDLLTLIPFTIVLIAPLTPVGHVLIFSFLQRYWPEFFPSTFSERRQSMMKKREIYLNMLEQEGKSEDEDDNNFEADEPSGAFDGNFNPRNLINRKKSSNVTSSRRSYQPQSTSSGPVESTNGVERTTSSVDLDLDQLTGKLSDKDMQERKERQRVALDELHLAD